MIKKNDRVVLENRGAKEVGTVIKKYRRKDVIYYDIKTDRGVVLERVTADPNFPCHVNESLTIKYNQK